MLNQTTSDQDVGSAVTRMRNNRSNSMNLENSTAVPDVRVAASGTSDKMSSPNSRKYGDAIRTPLSPEAETLRKKMFLLSALLFILIRVILTK